MLSHNTLGLLCSTNSITIVRPNCRKGHEMCGDPESLRHIPSLKATSASSRPPIFDGFNKATAPSCLFITYLAKADCSGCQRDAWYSMRSYWVNVPVQRLFGRGSQCSSLGKRPFAVRRQCYLRPRSILGVQRLYPSFRSRTKYSRI